MRERDPIGMLGYSVHSTLGCTAFLVNKPPFLKPHVVGRDQILFLRFSLTGYAVILKRQHVLEEWVDSILVK